MVADETETQRTLCLDQFLKLAGLCGTGGQAKLLIQSGDILLNGTIETRRRKKLSQGDVVEYNGQKFSPDSFL